MGWDNCPTDTSELAGAVLFTRIPPDFGHQLFTPFLQASHKDHPPSDMSTPTGVAYMKLRTIITAKPTLDRCLHASLETFRAYLRIRSLDYLLFHAMGSLKEACRTKYRL